MWPVGTFHSRTIPSGRGKYPPDQSRMEPAIMGRDATAGLPGDGRQEEDEEKRENPERIEIEGL